MVLPEKKKLEPTKPEPFRLQLDERGAVKISRWEQMVRRDLPLTLSVPNKVSSLDSNVTSMPCR